MAQTTNRKEFRHPLEQSQQKNLPDVQIHGLPFPRDRLRLVSAFCAVKGRAKGCVSVPRENGA
jgi:hypothetical protein